MAKGGCRGKTQSRFDAKKVTPFAVYRFLARFCVFLTVTCMTILIALILIDVFHFYALPMYPIV